MSKFISTYLGTLACLITGVVGISVLVLNSTGSPGRFLLSNLLSKNKRLLGEFSPKIIIVPGRLLGTLEYNLTLQIFYFKIESFLNNSSIDS